MRKSELFTQTILNICGFRTNQKIIVIESDDWGSIRMPSKQVYDKMVAAGYPVNRNLFEKYDSLLTESDLDSFFNVLTQFKDNRGKHPVVTANCVVANPDFKKIKESNFNEYHYELITETFKKYPDHHRNFEIWKRGMSEQLFFPQFHAREHLNVSKFMMALQSGNRDCIAGFENEMPGSISSGNTGSGNYYIEATRYIDNVDKQEKLDIYLEGLQIFEQLFGYKSESIIPTNYIWSNDFNASVSKSGVRYIQGIQNSYQPKGDEFEIFSRYTGKTDENGIVDLVRNCHFEPTLSIGEDVIGKCLRNISLSFFFNKPVIISTHRINFSGNIFIENRDKNLKLLEVLLSKIIRKWPDVIFMTTVELGRQTEL